MAKKFSKKQLESIINMVKPYIPGSIVMKASAYIDPKARENTYRNVYDRSMKDFLNANRQYNDFDFSNVTEHILEVIDKRTLISEG